MWNRATLPIHETLGVAMSARFVPPGPCREKVGNYERASTMKSPSWPRIQSITRMVPPTVDPEYMNFFSRLHAGRGEADATYEGGRVNEELRAPYA